MKCSMVSVAVYNKTSRWGVVVSGYSVAETVSERVPSGFIFVVVIERAEL